MAAFPSAQYTTKRSSAEMGLKEIWLKFAHSLLGDMFHCTWICLNNISVIFVNRWYDGNGGYVILVFKGFLLLRYILYEDGVLHNSRLISGDPVLQTHHIILISMKPAKWFQYCCSRVIWIFTGRFQQIATDSSKRCCSQAPLFMHGC